MPATTPAVVQLHHRYGMIMFIASEVMFFAAWFWAYFEAALYARPTRYRPRAVSSFTGGTLAARRVSPGVRSLAPAAAQHPDPADLGHHHHLGSPRPAATTTARVLKYGLMAAPIILGVLFTGLPGLRVQPTPHFGFSGSIYSATFFMATGFHGFARASSGRSSSTICLLPRVYAGPIHGPEQHLGFEFGRLVLALRRCGLAVPVRLHLCLGCGDARRALEHRFLVRNHLMVQNRFIRLGAKRGAMRGIGQALQRRRWADLAHRRPVFRARWTSLRPTCGHPDHGADLASPANAKKRSNDSVLRIDALVQPGGPSGPPAHHL